MDQPSEHHLYLHTLIAASTLICLLDQLKDTHYYRGTLKGRSNQLVAELSKMLDKDMMALINADIVPGHGITEMMICHQQLIEEICRHHIHDFPILTEILQRFREDPEGIVNYPPTANADGMGFEPK